MFHANFRPRLRHPLARLIGGILGILAVLGVLALGLFAFATLLIGAAVWLLINAFRRPRMATARPAPSTPAAGVIDGEFTVIRNPDNHSSGRR